VTPAGSSRTARTAACSPPILEKLSGALGEFDEVALGHLFMFDEAGDLCAYDGVDVVLIGDDVGYVLAAELFTNRFNSCSLRFTCLSSFCTELLLPIALLTNEPPSY
jgi:hypothetical protein